MEQQSAMHEINTDLIDKITGYMRVGADYMLASAACGIPEVVAAKWLSEAELAYKKNENSIYRRLYEGIRTSKAHCEVIMLQRLAAEGGASGAKWLLEKLFAGKYCNKDDKPAPVKENLKKVSRAKPQSMANDAAKYLLDEL